MWLEPWCFESSLYSEIRMLREREREREREKEGGERLMKSPSVYAAFEKEISFWSVTQRVTLKQKLGEEQCCGKRQ